MSLYIRTKMFQILEVTKKKEDTSFKDVTYWYKCKHNRYTIHSDFVVKESDNIEDLVDGYVTYDVNNGYDFFTEKGWDETYPFENNLKEEKNNTLWVMNNRPDLEPALYGAIWTNKCLMFVAKINKDGEWELI